MTAFDQAWSLVKMPMYHGTTEDAWEQIQEDGFLKPYDAPPDFTSGEWGSRKKELQELLGMSDEEFEAKYGGDWSFFWGDQATPTMSTVGGKAGAIMMGAGWMDGVDDAVVLEIDDKHPDSPYFMPEIPIPDKILGRSIAWDDEYDQRRTNKPIPAHLIRRLSQEEIEEAIATDEQFADAENERSRLMSDAYRSRAMREAPDEDFYAHVAMRDKRNEWARKRRKKYWGAGQ
tara:strand:+ start:865 stop:1557 length:693 start_codon:yes stop_codon:yes gene_type:complete